MEKQLTQILEYFQNFDFTDLIGIGRILRVEEKEDFTDFVTEILVAYSEEDYLKRKQLLKLIKDIHEANKYLVKKSDAPASSPGVENDKN